MGTSKHVCHGMHTRDTCTQHPLAVFRTLPAPCLPLSSPPPLTLFVSPAEPCLPFMGPPPPRGPASSTDAFVMPTPRPPELLPRMPACEGLPLPTIMRAPPTAIRGTGEGCGGCKLGRSACERATGLEAAGLLPLRSNVMQGRGATTLAWAGAAWTRDSRPGTPTLNVAILIVHACVPA